MRRHLPVLVAASVLALAACGGDEEPAAQQWAGDVCAAVDSWQTELQQIFNDVSAQVTSGDAGAVDAIRAGIDQGAEATDELGETLRGLGPPDTEAGEEAQQQLEAVSDEVQTAVGQVQTAVDELGEASPQEILGALSGIVVPLQAALGQIEAVVANLRENAADEIRQGFEDAPECQELAGQTTADS
jgi:hypothetical protein